MILLHIIHIAGLLIVVLGAGITWSYEAFIVGRFVMGFAGGLGLSKHVAVSMFINIKK